MEMTLNNMSLTKESVEIEKVVQTTPSQLEIWLACKLGGKEANMAYNESVSIQLTGKLNVKSLQAAFLKIIERHDAMRAVIGPNGKHLIVFSSYELPIRLRDISEMTLVEKKKFLKKHSLETGKYQFNLTQGPLYVMELIKLDEIHHQLTFTGHHIIFDGWSLTVMLEELASLYSSIVLDIPQSLGDPDNLSDYSVELINFTRKSSYKATKRFWTEYLSNPVPDLKLPLDKPRPRYRTYACEVLEVLMDDRLLRKVKEFSGKQKVSLNHTLLSIFEIFLSEWTHQDDIVVGMPVAGQLLMNKPSLIGHCVHLLPLRSKINPSESFSEYLQNRKKAYNETLDHQAISFGSMVQDLPIKRDPSRIPLVPVTFNIDMGMDNSVSFSGLENKVIFNPKAYANFEIIINLYGSTDNNILVWTYNKDLFEESTIDEAAKRYISFIEKVLLDPEIKISELLEAFADENKVLTVQPPNHTDQVSSDFIPVSKLIQSNFQLFEDQLALHFQDEELSYQSMGEKVRSFAGYLVMKGIGPGDIIGVHLDRTSNLVLVIHGILMAGAAYVPVDFDFPEERVKFMLQDAGVKYFFTEKNDFDWEELNSKKLNLSPELFLQYAREFHPVAYHPNDPVFLIYTSGSTGTPKGVVLNQNNLFHFSQHYVSQPGIKAGDRVLGITSPSFDMHWMELVIPFAYGASVFLMNKYHRIDAREIIKTLEKNRITQLSATPSHLRSFVDHGLTKKLEGLRIISAGEPLSVGLAESLLQVCDSLYNIYGPSETTIFTNIKKIELGSKLITIGKPVPGTIVLLIGEDGKLITETGKVGELVIGGTGVSQGYLNRPELNREKFIQNPFPAYPGRFYKSGDLGQWTEEGEIICLGRIDHQVKIRGQRVELGEIESKISLDEKVRNVAVEKYSSDNGEDILRAFVSFKDNAKESFDPQAWIEACKNSLSQKVSSYMIPAQFVILEQLPLNSNGKIDRNGLKSYFDKDSKVVQGQKEISVKLINSEERIKRLWEKVLQIPNVDPNDDFFEIGGHSLLAVELISLIEKEYKVDLPLSILFEYPTIQSISIQVDKLVNEGKKLEIGCLVKIKEGNPNKALYFIHGVGLNPMEINTLNQYLDENQTVWGLQSPAVVDSTIAPISCLEEIASIYINQIKSAGLTGPFNLMGNSIGGIIAFEMARQLINRGDQVSFLGMIDTVAFQPDSKKSDRKLINKLFFEVKFFFNDPLYYLRYRRTTLEEMKNKVNGRVIKNEGTDLNSRINQIERVNMEAWKNYQHSVLDAKITLFRAERKTFYVRDSKTLGWGSFAREVSTITMPGDHANMLKPPYGAKFSKTLQSILNSLN
ncbi:MAG: amino acid adenylation domain-containing protein [Algoriphagus sp.]|nr:amino acid adenylation domain-containing protein [Algoriphagus sp.]